MKLSDEIMPPTRISLAASLPRSENEKLTNSSKKKMNGKRLFVTIPSHSSSISSLPTHNIVPSEQPDGMISPTSSVRRVQIDENSREIPEEMEIDSDDSFSSREDSGKSSGESGESDIESSTGSSIWAPSKSSSTLSSPKSLNSSSNSLRNRSSSNPPTPQPERMTTRSKGLNHPSLHSSQDNIETPKKSNSEETTPARVLRREKSREVLKLSELEDGHIIIPCFLPATIASLTPKTGEESIFTPTWRSVDIEAGFISTLESGKECSSGISSLESSVENLEEEKDKISVTRKTQEIQGKFNLVVENEEEREESTSSDEDTSDESFCTRHFCRELVERNLMGHLMHKIEIPEKVEGLPSEFFKQAGELYLKKKRRKHHLSELELSNELEKKFEKLRKNYLDPPKFLERTWKPEEEREFLPERFASPRATPNRLRRSSSWLSSSSSSKRKTSSVRYLRDCPSSQEAEDHFDISEEELTAVELETGRISIKIKRQRRIPSSQKKRKNFHPSETVETPPLLPAFIWQPLPPVENVTIDPTLGRERLVVRMKKIFLSSPKSCEEQKTSSTSTIEISESTVLPFKEGEEVKNNSIRIEINQTQERREEKKSETRKPTEDPNSIPTLITPFISQ